MLAATYWYYLMEGAATAYDVRFKEPKTKTEVLDYLKDLWNTNEIKQVWIGDRGRVINT